MIVNSTHVVLCCDIDKRFLRDQILFDLLFEYCLNYNIEPFFLINDALHTSSELLRK